MKATLLHILTVAAMMAASLNAMAVTPAAPFAEESLTASLTSTGTASSAASVMPLVLTATDLVTKVYGVLDTSLPKDEALKIAESRYNLTPTADSSGFWLEPADGYVVDYYGMSPQVSAVANFDDEGATDYSYFILFPYEAGRRPAADYEQCAFCGTLLQEMQDLGVIVGVPDVSDAVFEAFGSMKGSAVNVKLVEEVYTDDSGRFILIIGVTPGAFTNADDHLALY